MGAPELLHALKGQGFRVWADGERVMVAPRAFITEETRRLIREHKAELLAALATDTLPDPGAKARLRRVLVMLAENPNKRLAFLTHDDGDPEGVALTLAIRGRATCELRIPRDRYDPFLLADLVERHGGTEH